MKATHRGHCQACGRLQMLPSGRLAKHGYRVDHGYFSGTCVGSAHLPFEQSFALVLDFIDGAKKQLAVVEAEQKRLREEPNEKTLMWARIWYPTSGRFAGHYEWEQVNLTVRFEPYASDPSSGSLKYRFEDRIGRQHGEHSSGFYGVQRWEVTGQSDQSDEAARRATVLKYNRVRADWLEHEADSLRRYIVWQTERVTTWTEQPLLPVDAKDKQGFVPTAAAY